jgi:protein-L-isoaspartate(D-aspartate) O-methyltransferase
MESSGTQHTDRDDTVAARHRRERLRMVEAIRAMAGDPWMHAGPVSERVLAVMAEVPRHRFVPDEEEYGAYQNRPLPIGHGQTISQPYIVAVMTDLLAPEKHHRVLEVGTGSGYQAAVLSALAGEVYSIEIVESLARAAAQRLHELGCGNVEVKAGDGAAGWPEHAPYDGIIVTAAAGAVPPALLDQLKPGGRMVIPVGGQFDAQQLLLITRDHTGGYRQQDIEAVRFVPLTGGRP